MANARKTAQQLRISQIGDFRARMGGVMELPSGLVVKAKNPGGLTAFIANGTIPNSLLSVVQEQLGSGNSKASTEEAMRNMSEDMSALGDMMKLMDIIVAGTIIEPKVKPVPTEDDVVKHNLLNPSNPVSTPDELRDEDNFLYTDDLDQMDKQFIWQWVSGGTRDLEQFRKELEVNVAVVSAGKEPQAGSQSDDGADAG